MTIIALITIILLSIDILITLIYIRTNKSYQIKIERLEYENKRIKVEKIVKETKLKRKIELLYETLDESNAAFYKLNNVCNGYQKIVKDLMSRDCTKK